MAKALLRLLIGAVVGLLLSQWMLSGLVRPSDAKTGDATTPPAPDDHSIPQPVRITHPQTKAALSPAATSPRGEKMLAQLREFSTYSPDELASLFEEFRLGTKLQKALLKEWARRDPAEMFEVLNGSTALSDDDKGDWFDIVLAEWVRRSPREAIDRLAEIPESANSVSHLALHRQLMLQGHVEKALELQSHTKMIWWGGPNPENFLPWFQANQSKAFEMVSRIPMEGLRHQYLDLMAKESAHHDPEAALEKASQLPERDRGAWLESIIGGLAESSYSDAITLLQDHVSDPRLLSSATPAIIKWMADDPQAALTWTRQNLVGKARLDITVKALESLANTDWQLASSAAGSIENSTMKNAAFSMLLEKRLHEKTPLDLDKLDLWIAEISDPVVTAHMLDHNAGNLVHRNPALAQHMAEQDDPLLARQAIIRSAARNLSREDRDAARRWLETLPERNRMIAEKEMR